VTRPRLCPAEETFGPAHRRFTDLPRMPRLRTSVRSWILAGIAASIGAVAMAAPTAAPSAADGEPVSFRRDAMAVLSKASCASGAGGACHGNRAGKGGFKLTLRGHDPVPDRTALVDVDVDA